MNILKEKKNSVTKNNILDKILETPERAFQSDLQWLGVRRMP